MDVAHLCRQEAGLWVCDSIIHTATNVLGFKAAQKADAIERLLAEDRRMVARLADLVMGKRLLPYL